MAPEAGGILLPEILHKINKKYFLQKQNHFGTNGVLIIDGADMVESEERDDIKLMTAVSSGDDQAYTRLVYKYRTPLQRFYISLGEEKNSAEDLAQEALLRLWIARKRYEPSARFTTYLFGIARNCWLNTLRLRKRHQDGETIDDPDMQLHISPAWPCNPVFNSYRLQEIHRAIASLPENQREVFVLCHIQGFTCVETAGILDVPVGTIKSRMSAAVNRLRSMLENWREP